MFSLNIRKLDKSLLIMYWKKNVKKKAKSSSTFGYSTFHTTIPHKLLLNVLSIVPSNQKSENVLAFLKHLCIGPPRELEEDISLKNSCQCYVFPPKKCFSTLDNMVFKQDIGITIGIDPAPFCASLFLYSVESKYVKQLISNGSSEACEYHGFSRFIDDLCAKNHDNEFLTSLKKYLS